jgi:uncharacterized protein YuzE
MDLPVTYDASVDCAYIQLVPRVGRGAAVAQEVVEAPGDHATVVLDFDAEGRLLGIEVVGARAALAESVLEHATRIG